MWIDKELLFDQLIEEQNKYMAYDGYSCFWDPWAGRPSEYLLHGNRRIKHSSMSWIYGQIDLRRN